MFEIIMDINSTRTPSKGVLQCFLGTATLMKMSNMLHIEVPTAILNKWKSVRRRGGTVSRTLSQGLSSVQCFLLCKLISEQNKSGLVGGENTMIRRGKETKFLCCLLKSTLLTTYSTYTFTSTNINNKQGHVYCTAVR